MQMTRVIVSALILSYLVASVVVHADKPVAVAYDGRSMIINGNRELLFSGSIHYPRSPPELWAELIRKSKDGGLNLIQTYVFWNLHEPIEGQFNFEGNNDVVKFIKMIHEQGLWVTLRIGPYIEAEWNAGGFPYWLREVPNITFRSYNEPFMYHMKKYSEKIIRMMESEKLFAPQGGPIIMAQIENEYNNVQLAYRDLGVKYIHWAAEMATELYPHVPWIMCKQKNAPDKVINTCNGRQCGDTFTGPNGPNKPSMWTENWTAQYRTFGDPPSQRAAEDIAYAVARFFSRNGTLTNYYMYHGGTNFGRTSSSFVTTRYYDEAPLDEFGLRREPKWGHLKDLHRALKLARKPLLWGTQKVERINKELEITTYENLEERTCVAFLANNNSKNVQTVKFRGVDYSLLPTSITILPDCKTVVYNTQLVASQHNARNFVPSIKARNFKWEVYQEKIPTINDLHLKNKQPLELYTLTRDVSDYAWYSTRIYFDKRDLPRRSDILPVLQIASLGHALVAFVNGKYVATAHGNNIEKSFLFQKAILLKPGVNDITVLAMTVGFPNSGAYMEKRFAGPRAVTIQGLMAGTLDITLNNWGHEVGVYGEREQIYKEESASKVKWTPITEFRGGAVTWYKTSFHAPEGEDPVAIKMNKMSKGMIWVNGVSIGRYWSSFVSPLGEPSQSEYHIPRAFIRPRWNTLVVFEEDGGNPEAIEIVTVNRDTICSIITEEHPPNVASWENTRNGFRSIYEHPRQSVELTCPEDKVIKVIEFASYGNAEGFCGSFSAGQCNAANSQTVAEQHCLGKSSCSIPFHPRLFSALGHDCHGPSLVVQAKCGK